MRDAGHRTPDAGHRTTDIGHRTSDGEKSKNNISTPQGGGHNNIRMHNCRDIEYLTCSKMQNIRFSVMSVASTDRYENVRP